MQPGLSPSAPRGLLVQGTLNHGTTTSVSPVQGLTDFKSCDGGLASFFPLRHWFVFSEKEVDALRVFVFLTSQAIAKIVMCELKPVTNSAPGGIY